MITLKSLPLPPPPATPAPKSLYLHFPFRNLFSLSLAEDSSFREIKPEENLVLRMWAQFRVEERSNPGKKGDREFTSEMMTFPPGAPTCKLSECYLGSLDHTKPGPPCPRQDLEDPSLLDNWPAPEKSPSVTTICFFSKTVVLVTLWPFIYQFICSKSFSLIVV